MRTGLLLSFILVISLARAQVLPSVEFSRDFIGDQNLQVTQISGRLEDWVAVASTTPVHYVNQAGDLSCPILYHIKDDQWQLYATGMFDQAGGQRKV